MYVTPRPTQTHNPDSDFEPTSLCSISLMVRYIRRSNKYQLQSSVWPDQCLNPWSTALSASTLSITTQSQMRLYWAFLWLCLDVQVAQG